MASSRVVEYIFFFGLMGVVGYILWQMLVPFISALALAAIIATITYPLHDRVRRMVTVGGESTAALITTLITLIALILPVLLLSSAVVREAISLYNLLNESEPSMIASIETLEEYARQYYPSFELNVTEYVRQAARWVSSNVGAIFAGTASTIFLFFISLIGSFYFFRDGREFTRWLIRISPLPNNEDELILERLSTAVRAVATGTVLIALIQGVLTAVGLTIFGIERAVLLGSIAAIGALIPSVGTSIVLIPSVVFLLFTGEYTNAIGLTVWGMLAVGLIDNLLGPYLISRGNAMHPFVILLAVLGGLAMFGPIGFVVGPVLVSFFLVLLELYHRHIADQSSEDSV